ncbi:hypothetical protein VDGE_20887 [Verticillium dahliae]|uniref:Fibronectin type III-like domain-containing protein n=1 Tax=Verticillium dahliae TaxID=27337 RepID=A0A444RUW2_VERDA|nr:hypothetical protein VDGE_20887 [Verticillium dahliae]
MLMMMSSFEVFFLALVFWSVQVQCLMQIIVNRIALLMHDPAQTTRLRWGVFLLLLAVNVSVFCVWIPARLQISPGITHANDIWDRVEKGIFLVIDAALNLAFIFLVRSRLIAYGLTKYKVLFQFNLAMICISMSLDVMLIGLIYTLFHPLAYLAKLHIEMNMAQLIAKVVKSSHELNSFEKPRGRLPYTVPKWPKDYDFPVVNLTEPDGSLVRDSSKWQSDFTEGHLIDYHHVDAKNIEPLYEFSFGLGYTKVEVGKEITVSKLNKGNLSELPDAKAKIEFGGNVDLFTELLQVEAEVSNTGKREGTTTVQLYMSFPESEVMEKASVKVLRGFERVTLAPGANAKVHMTKRAVLSPSHEAAFEPVILLRG